MLQLSQSFVIRSHQPATYLSTAAASLSRSLPVSWGTNTSTLAEEKILHSNKLAQQLKQGQLPKLGGQRCVDREQHAEDKTENWGRLLEAC